MNLREIDQWIRETQEAAIEEVRAGWAYDRRAYKRGYLLAAPLLEFVELRLSRYLAEHGNSDSEGRRIASGLTEFCVAHGLNDNHIYRLRRRDWVVPDTADTICCRLGIHPIQIYGNLWTDDGRLFA